MIISSKHNDSYKLLQKLNDGKNRKKQHLFLVEGRHLVEEAQKNELLVHLVLNEEIPCSLQHDSCWVMSADLYQSLSLVSSKSECMGVCRYPAPIKDYGTRVLLLDRIQDPGNFGTIIRTAVAFGFDAIITSDDCVDLGNEKVIRSTQGALFQIPVMTQNLSDSIATLKQQGFEVYGTSLQDSIALSSLHDSPSKVALVFGNEGAGVSSTLLEHCDKRISIEMANFESLNVAIACGILAYRFRKS